MSSRSQESQQSAENHPVSKLDSSVGVNAVKESKQHSACTHSPFTAPWLHVWRRQSHKRGRRLLGGKETGGVAKPQCHWREDCTGSCAHGPRTTRRRPTCSDPTQSNVHTQDTSDVKHTQDMLGAAALMSDNFNRPHLQPAPCDTPCERKPQGLAHHTPTTRVSQQATETPTHSGTAAAAGTQHCASVRPSSMCFSPTHRYPAAAPAPVQLRRMRAPSARRLKKDAASNSGGCRRLAGLWEKTR